MNTKLRLHFWNFLKCIITPLLLLLFVWSPCGIVANVLDCDIVVRSSNPSCVILFTFGLMSLEKAWNPLTLKLLDSTTTVFLQEWFDIK